MGGVIVIFGGAGGIGEATARAVTAKGYRAHLVGRNEARLAAAAGSIAGATYSVADVTDSGAITQAVAAAAEQGGGALAGLCYAAGTITLKPVARISDALLNPGAEYDFNGQRRAYPDIRLMYWCGGNAFHQQQQINKLLEGWTRPETIIVHEPWWTPTAKRWTRTSPPASRPPSRHPRARVARPGRRPRTQSIPRPTRSTPRPTPRPPPRSWNRPRPQAYRTVHPG